MIAANSCEERCDPYFRYMNEEAGDNYDLRCRYLYKIYQVGISPMYTMNERKSVVYRLLENASEQIDDGNRALDVICAYKIVQYNGFEITVPKYRLQNTLWLGNASPVKEIPDTIRKHMSDRLLEKTLNFAESLGPNKDILDQYNVAIQKHWFASFNPMKTELDDGLYDGMNEIEAFNRRNSNALKCIIISLIYHKKMAEDIEYFRLAFRDGNPYVYRKKIIDIPDLNSLEDSGDQSIEYYWMTLKSNPLLFDKYGKDHIEDLETKTYKITMFHKDFDHSSGNLHVLPGAIQVWKLKEEEETELFSIENGNVNEQHKEGIPDSKCGGGTVFEEDGWTPIVLSNAEEKDRRYSRNIYMLWYKWRDLWNHINYAIGNQTYNFEKNERCLPVYHSKEFYGEGLKNQVYKNLKLGRGGVNTYWFLKFKDALNPDSEKIIVCGYDIVYTKEAGYLYDFNGKENYRSYGKIYYGKIGKEQTKSPNDFIVSGEKMGYWKLNYDGKGGGA